MAQSNFFPRNIQRLRLRKSEHRFLFLSGR